MEGEPDTSSEVSRVEFWILIVVLSHLCVFGTAGNALILFVFSKKKDELVSTVFIISLAFVDFVTCLIVIPLTLYMEYVTFHIDADFLCKLYQFLITSNIPFSALVMVAIAVDRYLCICHPFLRAFSIPRAKMTVAVLGVAATCIGICVALMYGVSPISELPFASSPSPLNRTTSSSLNEPRIKYHDDNDTWFGANAPPGVSTVGRIITLTVADGRVMDTSPLNYPINSTIVALNRTAVLSATIAADRLCKFTYAIVSPEFVQLYQKCYTALFLACLMAVIVLYVLIYRSVLQRRDRRRRQKSASISLRGALEDNHYECKASSTAISRALLKGEQREAGATRDRAMSTDIELNCSTAVEVHAVGSEMVRALAARADSSLARRDHIANLKTAAMLFVVTLVFIVTFLPAFLMMLELIPYNIVVFYAYFANNVANPVIYSFMNKNFRENLVRLFCRGRPGAGGVGGRLKGHGARSRQM